MTQGSPPPSGKDAKVEGRDDETPMERFKALSRRLVNVSNAEVQELAKQTATRSKPVRKPRS